MMGRFCRYIDKVFQFGGLLQRLQEPRQQPQIPVTTVFASAFAMFAMARRSLNSLERDLVRIPSRLRGVVGPRPPSVDTIGRVYSAMDSAPLRQMVCDCAHQLRRNKALGPGGVFHIVAVDGHEFFASRKRCCPQCLTRTIQLKEETVTEYYHRGVVCHLIDRDLALPLDVELLRPGEGEETAAKRLLERVFAQYSRFIDVVVGDALYLDAPFINFCLDHHKHAIVVIKGEQRLLLQDAQGLFAHQAPSEWSQKKRSIRAWDQEGFTSCEGVASLRVLHTEELIRRRERIAGQWRETQETSSWYWATTLSKNQFSTRELYRAGHHRWDIENDCFNTLSRDWALDHCFKHDPTAIGNFILTLFIAYILLQCFWRRNLKRPLQKTIGSLIGLAEELHRSLGATCRAPWSGHWSRAP